MLPQPLVRPLLPGNPPTTILGLCCAPMILGFRFSFSPPADHRMGGETVQGRVFIGICGDPLILTRADSRMHSCWAVPTFYSVPYVLIRTLNTTLPPFSRSHADLLYNKIQVRFPVSPSPSQLFRLLKTLSGGLTSSPSSPSPLHYHNPPQLAATTNLNHPLHTIHPVSMNPKPVQSKPPKPTEGQENIRSAASSNGAPLF